jgi:hypothetical protein
MDNTLMKPLFSNVEKGVVDWLRQNKLKCNIIEKQRNTHQPLWQVH